MLMATAAAWWLPQVLTTRGSGKIPTEAAVKEPMAPRHLPARNPVLLDIRCYPTS